MKIYIAHKELNITLAKELFVLTRPFFSDLKWSDNKETKLKWIGNNIFHYTDKIEEADFLLIGMPINKYVDAKKLYLLNEFNNLCVTHGLHGYGFISGDFGKEYPEFSNLTYFRLGGFKSQLSNKNIGFPVTISDYYENSSGNSSFNPSSKREKPIIGFCGHATPSLFKKFAELGKIVLENTKRFISNPFRSDWEPLFASANERWKLLQILEKSSDLQCKFIYRNKYRAGAKTKEARNLTTEEYYCNLIESDYVLCIRGAGNFSVRFYETLMVGKIPIFVNTDCLLPLEDKVDWKRHVVWVEWKERHLIAHKVLEFHKKKSPEDFIEMQYMNRKLWKEDLAINNYLNLIGNK